MLMQFSYKVSLIQIAGMITNLYIIDMTLTHYFI